MTTYTELTDKAAEQMLAAMQPMNDLTSSVRRLRPSRPSASSRPCPPPDGVPTRPGGRDRALRLRREAAHRPEGLRLPPGRRRRPRRRSRPRAEVTSHLVHQPSGRRQPHGMLRENAMPTLRTDARVRAQPAAAGARSAEGHGGVRGHGRNRRVHPTGTPRRRQPRRRPPRLHRVGQLHLRLEKLLERLGHRPVAWGLGRNVGPTREVIDGIDDSGAAPLRRGRTIRPARRLEPGRHLRPSRRRTPARDGPQGHHPGQPLPHHPTGRTWPHAAWMYDLYAPLRRAPPATSDVGGAASRPLTVPTHLDLLAERRHRSRGQLHRAGDRPRRERRPPGSHNGLAHNPLALYVVADRLALPPGVLPRFAPPRAVRPFFDLGHG